MKSYKRLSHLTLLFVLINLMSVSDARAGKPETSIEPDRDREQVHNVFEATFMEHNNKLPDIYRVLDSEVPEAAKRGCDKKVCKDWRADKLSITVFKVPVETKFFYAFSVEAPPKNKKYLGFVRWYAVFDKNGNSIDVAALKNKDADHLVEWQCCAP